MKGIQDKDSLYWIFGCIMILASVTMTIGLAALLS